MPEFIHSDGWTWKRVCVVAAVFNCKLACMYFHPFFIINKHTYTHITQKAINQWFTCETSLSSMGISLANAPLNHHADCYFFFFILLAFFSLSLSTRTQGALMKHIHPSIHYHLVSSRFFSSRSLSHSLTHSEWCVLPVKRISGCIQYKKNNTIQCMPLATPKNKLILTIHKNR